MHDNMLVRKTKASKNKSIQEGSGVGVEDQFKVRVGKLNPTQWTRPNPIQFNFNGLSGLFWVNWVNFFKPN